MIPTIQLLYKLEYRLNKIASVQHQSISEEDRLLALNEAQIKLVKKKLNQNNIYSLGFDSFTKRYEDLQVLVVPFEELPVTKNTTGYSAYSGDLLSLSKKYMLPLEMYALCSRGKCTNRTVAITRIVKHGDLNVLLYNKNYCPSFEYQETLASISDNKVSIYTGGEFEVSQLNISYLRYPQKIDREGYIDFNGNPSTDSNCELADYLEDELLDLATLEIAMSTENTPQVQYTSEIRNKINE